MSLAICDLLHRQEKRGKGKNINPMNSVARYLYRHNPKYQTETVCEETIYPSSRFSQ